MIVDRRGIAASQRDAVRARHRRRATLLRITRAISLLWFTCNVNKNAANGNGAVRALARNARKRTPHRFTPRVPLARIDACVHAHAAIAPTCALAHRDDQRAADRIKRVSACA